MAENDQDKERISLYVSKYAKEEWQTFAKNNGYSTLSKLIREALEFFIQYRSKIILKDKNVEIDLLSRLSHDLKEPLTSIKGYVQLIIEKSGDSMEKNIILILKNVLGAVYVKLYVLWMPLNSDRFPKLHRILLTNRTLNC